MHIFVARAAGVLSLLGLCPGGRPQQEHKLERNTQRQDGDQQNVPRPGCELGVRVDEQPADGGGQCQAHQPAEPKKFAP